MALWDSYHLAHSLEDALQALAAAPGPARLIAGGSDLLLDLQQGRQEPVHTLVDVTRISEMTALELRQDSLYIGAALPLGRVVDSPLVRRHAQALFEAASQIGGPQVRNTATLGGNVAHALPAADGAIALLALDAQAEVASRDGLCRVPLESLYLGPGRSALRPREEILVGFRLPLHKAGQASAFQRVMRPQGVAIAILNMAIWLEGREGRVHQARMALGPAGPVPFRLRQAETVLRGAALDESTISRALAALLEEAHFRTSPHRATADYRRHLAGILLRQALNLAWERLTQSDE